jgi:hypothetical protein
MARHRPTDASAIEGVAEDGAIGRDPAVATEPPNNPHRPPSQAGAADLPLHPFLFAAFSVFAPYAANLRETSFADVVAPLVAVITATALLFIVVGRLAGRYGPRAALVTSIVLAGTIFHLGSFSLVNRLLGGVIPTTAAVPATLVAMTALILIVATLRFSLTLPNAVLNGMAFVLLAVPVWQAGSHELRRLQEAGTSTTTHAADVGGFGTAASAALAAEKQPDIYYFIFDRYGSNATLAREFGFDNSGLTRFLEGHGFYVASESRANYLKTAPSLAATFNMDYINFLAREKRASHGDWHPVYDMLKDHKVGRFLKSKGYRFIQIGSWWNPTEHNPFADESYSFGFTEFEWLYLRRTLFPPLLEAVAPRNGLAQTLAWDAGQCRRVPLQFEKVRAIGERPEPTFTFVHVLLPHEPFVFDEHGRCHTQKWSWTIGVTPGYTGQVRYANRLIEETVASLLARSGPKPIIIIQADEGPFPERYRFSNLSWQKATKAELQMKMGILNAFYFPDGDYRDLYRSITSVNTFRVVLNKHFGTDMDLLPDRIYAFPDVFRIYDFYEITDIAGAAAD